MKLAFSGPRVSGHNEELDTSGGTGTAIVVQAAGKNVSFDGTEGDANTLKDGDNVLHYTAIVKKSSANNAQVTEGAFSAVATKLNLHSDVTFICFSEACPQIELLSCGRTVLPRLLLSFQKPVCCHASP